MTRERMPRGFTAWVVATVGADLGAGVLAFAMTWVASGFGPDAAAAVLTLTVAPTVVFGLLGGAVADRFGARRVMLVCTALLMLISATLAVVATISSPVPAVLLITAAAVGSVSAFHRPAVGVFPRLFVDDTDLGTAMARVGTASQLAGILAPALGGVLIATISLAGVAWIDVLGCLAMLVVLLLVRPPRVLGAAPNAISIRGILEGIVAARATAGVRSLLLAVGIVAGAVIPSVILGIPLAARERGWSAAQAGMIEAGWITGGLLVGAWYSWRGTAKRAWLRMAAGPVIVAGGIAGLAVSDDWLLAAVSTCSVGIGVVVFTAHVFPTYVLLAPASMVSRFQSLLILVQRAPQLLVSPLLGALIAAHATGPVLLLFAAVALIATAVVASDRALRDLSAPSP